MRQYMEGVSGYRKNLGETSWGKCSGECPTPGMGVIFVTNIAVVPQQDVAYLLRFSLINDIGRLRTAITLCSALNTHLAEPTREI